MQGFDTLWLPGMDHAAIATEAKVVKKLKDEGINKYEYGRENFLKACWDWPKRINSMSELFIRMKAIYVRYITF